MASWIVWVLAALLFWEAVKFLEHMPAARDFRRAALVLGAIGLVVSALGAPWLRWQLVWYTPVALLCAYLFALRRLLLLSHRINKLAKGGVDDPEAFRKRLEQEVTRYNSGTDESSRMR